ncbi:MAG: hypothetical protein A3E01_02725 [Gammaproteobacteria bacterium RIFCSPHIGHO2_12_FULL_63_22]|nr:MAG: hypothetical protein A3E01_02725 [Gammaproteobacteria bacterium RIFCSPHIGHO2_12_FULL_63_22]
MSEESLLLAVRNEIRTSLKYKPSECDVEFDGRPLAIAGETYIAVWPGEWSNDGQTEHFLDERHGVQVNVYLRAPKVPRDRSRNLLLDAKASVNVRCRAIMLAIHMNYAVMDAANDLLLPSATGFHHPLRFQGCSAPQVVTGDYFYAQSESFAGLLRTIRFGGAIRYQTLPAT